MHLTYILSCYLPLSLCCSLVPSLPLSLFVYLTSSPPLSISISMLLSRHLPRHHLSLSVNFFLLCLILIGKSAFYRIYLLCYIYHGSCSQLFSELSSTSRISDPDLPAPNLHLASTWTALEGRLL